jgi:hypothetical protein
MAQDHLLRSSSVVQKVKYGNRRVEYRTFDAVGTDVLRLSFKPSRVTAGGTPLAERNDLKKESYTVQPVAGDYYVVRVRHTRSNEIALSGS